jgi:hypothetical protein
MNDEVTMLPPPPATGLLHGVIAMQIYTNIRMWPFLSSNDVALHTAYRTVWVHHHGAIEIPYLMVSSTSRKASRFHFKFVYRRENFIIEIQRKFAHKKWETKRLLGVHSVPSQRFRLPFGKWITFKIMKLAVIAVSYYGCLYFQKTTGNGSVPQCMVKWFTQGLPQSCNAILYW